MIIWLASYPKSGNTWVRSIIASLLYSNDGDFNFDLIKNIKQFPQKIYFNKFTEKIGEFSEIKKYWIPAQELINQDNKIRFFKTHHINCNVDGYKFTNKENTLATIYIVRDPRNLVNSISNHFSKSIEESKKFLITPRFIAGSKKHGEFKEENLKTLIGTWAEHYNFWKRTNNFLLIKYEDLVKDTEKELIKIINFLKQFINIQTSQEKNKKIIETTGFKNLKHLENLGKFNENAFENEHKKKNFFYLGPENQWHKNLDNKIINEIENKFNNEMKELEYIK